MGYEYKTTTGTVRWNESASQMEDADDPFEPDGEGWELVSSSISEIRFSKQVIFWFWKRFEMR